MKHIPAYCDAFIMNVRPGDTLAACDFKEIIYLGRSKRGNDMFAIYYKGTAKALRMRGFARARELYNSLPIP
jgi:hypothetical protein